MTITTREFLSQATLTREMVDRFLNPEAKNWTAFDAELGYKLRNSVVKDGVDRSYTITRIRPSGARTMLNFAEQPCRINTYGNSFTQCQQVSDGESWQEYLAAHLGEPIRNFGVGGYGVFQAYRRMLRQEGTESSAEYTILNIFSNDHFRSIYKWRWLPKFEFGRELYKTVSLDPETWMFFGNPWSHLRLSPVTGKFEERENPYPTPDSLYLLCDKDHVYEAFRDDFEVQVILAELHATDINTRVLQEMAEVLEMPTDFSSPEAMSKTALALLESSALRSSMYVVDKAGDFARAEGKKLMVLLSFSSQHVIDACKGLPRFDQVFVDYLKETGLVFVDALDKHVEDYRLFSCSPEEYVRRYYVGHYSPAGNHFFAFAVKDTIVDWLEPKPPAYDFEKGPSLHALAVP